jgi:hypothetical protein
MDRKQLDEQRRSLFAALEKEFADELVPAQHNQDGEGRFDSLTLFLEDLTGAGNETIGEFFFLPFVDSDKADLQIFVNYFTIAEEIDEENLSELLAAASILNATIPVGAFAVDAESKSLIYRHAYEMPLPLSDEALKDLVDLSMGTAVQTLQTFGYMLLEVNDGERNAESLLRTLVPDKNGEGEQP